jgi:DNA-directed RNA polymerase specialized sigma24 family protein
MTALKKTSNRAAAEDLVQRASARLVRQGWDPREMPLVKRLCRLVWSECAHERRDAKKRRVAEEEFLGDRKLEGPHVSPSPEEIAAGRAEEARHQSYLDRLRVSFQAAGDEVNLLWLAYTGQGIDDLQEMARLSGREVTEFYRAADRRKRHVNRLIAENRGVKYEEKDG